MFRTDLSIFAGEEASNFGRALILTAHRCYTNLCRRPANSSSSSSSLPRNNPDIGAAACGAVSVGSSDRFDAESEILIGPAV